MVAHAACRAARPGQGRRRPRGGQGQGVQMASFKGQYGLQFTLHIASGYRAPEVVEHARLAHERGFSQIWINDNLRYRQQYVVLTAIAIQVPIALGTAITVPYFRNPVDFAGTLATLS